MKLSMSRLIPIMLGASGLLGMLVSALAVAGDHGQDKNRIDNKICNRVVVDTQPLPIRLPPGSVQWTQARVMQAALLGHAVSRTLTTASFAMESINGGIENPRQYGMDENTALMTAVFHLLMTRDVAADKATSQEREAGAVNMPGNVPGNIVYTF